jgi:ribose 1,5-bisphosphokinase PhnN
MPSMSPTFARVTVESSMRTLKVQFSYEVGLSEDEVSAKIQGLLDRLVERFRENGAEVTTKLERRIENKCVVEIAILSDPLGVFAEGS